MQTETSRAELDQTVLRLTREGHIVFAAFRDDPIWVIVHYPKVEDETR